MHVLNACDGHDSRTRTHKPAQSTRLCTPPWVGFDTCSLLVGFNKCSLHDTGWQRHRGCLICVDHSPQKRHKIELDLTFAASLAGTLHGLPMCPSEAGEGKAVQSTPVCVHVNVFAWVHVCVWPDVREKSLFSLVLLSCAKRVFSLSFCAKRVFSLSSYRLARKESFLSHFTRLAWKESFLTRFTGWQRLIGSPKLQIIFHKRATKYRALLLKMTHKDEGSYESFLSRFTRLRGSRQRLIGSFKLQIIFHKRATKYRSFLRKTIYKDSVLWVFARVAKTHRIPYLYRSFLPKVTYI